MTAAGEDNLAGKVLVDVANPLDASTGMPPALSVSNTDSLAERIQRRFPAARVVKTLNTMNAAVMVDPSLAGAGGHTVLLSGDDASARPSSATCSCRSAGRTSSTSATSPQRGVPEMLLPLWLRLFSALGTPRIQFKVVR